jgi:PTH2 family peptidyl-tRNA hydrolase
MKDFHHSMIPSNSSTLIICAVIAGFSGYYLGRRTVEPIIIEHTRRRSSATTDESYEEDSEEEQPDAEKDAHSDRRNEECKMVFVIRTDLKMTKGKVAAQCAHAALACYKSVARSNPDVLAQWERWGQAKITLQCPQEGDGDEQLHTLQAIAMSLNITARIIHDAGRTQIASGSATVLGLGPAPKSVIDMVTGSLKLY